MPLSSNGHHQAAQLYALRLGPPDAQHGLQGEIEHVVSGARCRFHHGAELLAWLASSQPLQGLAENAGAQPISSAAALDSADPDARDAST